VYVIILDILVYQIEKISTWGQFQIKYFEICCLMQINMTFSQGDPDFTHILYTTKSASLDNWV